MIKAEQVTIEKAIQLLEKQGVKLNSQDAEAVLDFMNLLADIYLSENAEL
ncbi:hypothetical protein HDF18_19755 [Mucilaginibacter sp. X5P1]|nr:hypothetical protein [Mucilaginibacter sp. X5P1]MBB6139892.1 hypothetical protein [Mucilaginibacter sp. X5P1]